MVESFSASHKAVRSTSGTPNLKKVRNELQRWGSHKVASGLLNGVGPETEREDAQGIILKSQLLFATSKHGHLVAEVCMELLDQCDTNHSDTGRGEPGGQNLAGVNAEGRWSILTVRSLWDVTN